ncbi:netrin-1 [Anguilla rostrata]|uniref:netrin-1 n=1 Tax=Anguilla rostrata TaxID=7938 RepID=UPI0030CF939E
MMSLPCSLPPLPVLFRLYLIPSLLLSPSLSHSPLRWTSSQDPCYHLDGRPRHCLSEFINAAYGVPVHAGDSWDGLMKNVSSLTDLHNPHNLTCWVGVGTGGDWTLMVPLGRRFEVTYISLQFCQQGELPDSLSISILKSMDHGRSWSPLQFYSTDCPGKFGHPSRTSAPSRHQETEPFCSDPRPLQRHRGGLVLAFSTLDGRPSSPDFDYSPVLQDWVTATDIKVVFHSHQSKQLKDEFGRGGGNALRWRAGSTGVGRIQTDRKGDQKTWGRPRTGLAEPGIGRKGGELRLGGQSFSEKEAHVKKTGVSGNRRGEGMHRTWKRSNKQRTGHAEDGHNVTRKEEESQQRGVASSRKGRGEGKRRGWKRGHQRRMCEGGVCDWTVEGDGSSRMRELRKRRTNSLSVVAQSKQRSRGLQQSPRPPSSFSPLSSLSSLSAPFSGPPLSLSDLQVGGRCKCNGHASRCRRDAQGRAVCQCEHHTAGPDCDVCQPFYCDRPWQRATPNQPHPCIPCECNGHSSKCRFSMEVFQQSGRRSGGVCLKCRHHTAGRHCQYCQNGYTRDHGKPMTHRQACRPCQCHPMGAVGRWCNQTSGQCLCRDGVTGVRCNRCAPGYQQGRSPIRPCLRIQEVVPTTPVYQPQYSIAEECNSYCQPSQVKVKMNLETYCLKDYVLKVQVRGMERSGPWWQFSVWVQTVFRVGESRVRRGQQALWVPDRDLGCGCPALQVGRTFLLIGGEDGQSWGPEDSRLVADRSSLALPWREHWSPKLRGFRGQDRRGRCPIDPPRNSTRSPSHWRPHKEFTPPHLVPPPSESLPPRPHPPPPTETKLPPHTHNPRDSLKPHPTEEGGSPPHQQTDHTHSPLQDEGDPQHPISSVPSPDTPLTPPTQQSHPRPKPAHTRKHSPVIPTPTQPLHPPH